MFGEINEMFFTYFKASQTRGYRSGLSIRENSELIQLLESQLGITFEKYKIFGNDRYNLDIFLLKKWKRNGCVLVEYSEKFC